jgi:pimeloyl-ACP methyl ester carboxylesterase
MLLRPRPAARRIPMLAIAAERDAVYGLDTQCGTAAAYGCELLVVPDAAHDLMLDPAWPIAAEAIERFANGIRGSR